VTSTGHRSPPSDWVLDTCHEEAEWPEHFVVRSYHYMHMELWVSKTL
jgi:hypothetical protein